MAYSQTTLDALAVQLGVLLDDTSERYWVRGEKYYSIYEALRVWGGATNYWRTRGAFSLTAGQSYYDLSAQLPTLRSRTWTLSQITQEIQYHLLEAANGISGAGMSEQVSIQSILNSIQRARNRLVLDLRFPLTVHPQLSPVSPPDGLVTFPQSTVYVHRAAWQDVSSATWHNLWRQDAWAKDHGSPDWTVEPTMPKSFSEAELAPLTLQLYPPPANSGTLEAITVDSLLIDTTNPAATFNVPDEWVHAIKYSALTELFSADSQLNDPSRAQYCQMRYSQCVDIAANAASIIRLLQGNVPLSIDSLAAVDAGNPYWRNQTGRSWTVGVMYDFLAFSPPDQAYGLTADVVQSAPLPANGAAYIQIGAEDLPHIIDYCQHILLMKCGGKEFESTFPKYDDFMNAIELRGAINKAKIQYLTPMFQQAQKEWAERSDYKMKRKAKANA